VRWRDPFGLWPEWLRSDLFVLRLVIKTGGPVHPTVRRGTAQGSSLTARLEGVFDGRPVISDEFYALLIHEFGHEYESNHLSASYYNALCTIGARMRTLDADT
jgi:hypothetical protein